MLAAWVLWLPAMLIGSRVDPHSLLIPIGVTLYSAAVVWSGIATAPRVKVLTAFVLGFLIVPLLALWLPHLTPKDWYVHHPGGDPPYSGAFLLGIIIACGLAYWCSSSRRQAELDRLSQYHGGDQREDGANNSR